MDCQGGGVGEPLSKERGERGIVVGDGVAEGDMVLSVGEGVVSCMYGNSVGV